MEAGEWKSQASNVAGRLVFLRSTGSLYLYVEVGRSRVEPRAERGIPRERSRPHVIYVAAFQATALLNTDLLAPARHDLGGGGRL